MGDLARFGNKNAGELIRAEDWNGLVQGIDTLGDELARRLGALETSVDQRLAALDERLGRAEAEIADAQGTVRTLLGQIRRVSLRTARTSYAMGESATLTVRVADALDSPLALADAAARPWVDFVTTWGQLRPAPGFTSLGGDGDRAVSVQVDERGEAAVLLRSEHTEGFTAEAEDEVAASLTTVLPDTGIRVSDAILAAATPMEASLRGAFGVMSREYDRADTVGVRNYVDNYFVRDPGRAVGTAVAPVFHGTWRDHRAIVLAFVKGDSDPSTAEPGQGVCSLQVTFRDWVSPWIHLEYLPQAPDLARDYRERLRPHVGRDFGETASGLRDEVARSVEGKGLVARHRDYQAFNLALDLLPEEGAQDFVRAAAGSVRNAIGLQQTLEPAQSTLGAGVPQVALTAFTAVSVRAESGAATAREEVARGLAQQVGLIQEQVQATVRIEQQGFRDEILREDGPVVVAQRAVETFRGQMSGIQEALGRKADVQTLVRFLPQ